MSPPRPEHLGIDATAACAALVTGDPGRVPAIAEMLGAARELTTRRGFMVWEAAHGTTPLLVVSTGIGAPATAIVVEELADLGIGTIVRIGTCGGLQPQLEVADLVISAGCVRDEGTTRRYVPLAFPALADPLVLGELSAGARAEGVRHHVGVTHCKDAYYSERPGRQADPEGARRRWETWRRSGVLCTEMEAAPLFIIGTLRGLRTGAVFVNVGTVTPPDAFAASLACAVRIAARAAAAAVQAPALPAPEWDGGTSFLERKGGGTLG